MESTPVMTSSGSRLAPPMLHPRSSSRTRSPTRSSSRSHISDDLLSDLTPATTLQAFTSPTGKLKASIEAASPKDRAFGIRATLASKKVQEWLEELSNWPWPKTGGSPGFAVPASKNIKSSTPKSDAQTSSQQHKEDPEPKPQYCGSLLFEQVVRYEYRIEEIGEGMDGLKVEEIKRQVLDTHFSANSRPSSSSSTIAMPTFLASYTVMDDFTAIVTATVLQALPNLAKLTRLMDIWGIRLSVLRRVPSLLLGLDDAEMALISGWQAIKIPGTHITGSGETADTVLSRQTFEVMKNVLQAKVTILGRDLDYMLDTLEGRMDTLPDSWLDRMENLERDYGEWVVAADRKITDGELAAIATPQVVEKDMPRAEDTEPSPEASVDLMNKNKEAGALGNQTARESSVVPISAINDDSTATDVNAHEEPTTTPPQQEIGISNGIVTTPEKTPYSCIAQLQVYESAQTTISKSPSPPQTPSPMLDFQPIAQQSACEGQVYTPLSRSTSVRSITKVPKFGHTFANALRRTISNDESPTTLSDDSLAVAPKISIRPSSVILDKFPSPPLKSPVRYDMARLRSSSSPLIIGAEHKPVVSKSSAHSSEDGSSFGATASSIALAQHLGISSASHISSQHVNMDTGKLREPAHSSSKPSHLPTHTTTIASSDGASESVQRFDPVGMEFDLLDARMESRRPSIIVDNIHADDSRDSDASDDSLSERCRSQMAQAAGSSPVDQDLDGTSTVTYEGSPLPPRKMAHDLQKYDNTPPGSPPGAPTRSARRPPQLLESPDFSHLMSTADDASFLHDVNVLESIPASPVIRNSDDQMQQQIINLLQSIPAHIRLRSEPEEKSNSQGIRPRKARRSVTPSMPSVRSQSSIGSLRAPTPSFTLAPAYAKSGTPRHRPQNGSPEIKVYHLSRSSGEKPIKLFVRLVGERGERVMVRVGGGWADLGEYLKEYASHHGRRAPVDTDKVEVQDLPPRIPSGGSTIRENGRTTPGPGRTTPGPGRTTPGPRSASAMGVRPSTAVDRPKSSLGIRKTRKSTFSSSDEVPPLPTTPFAEVQREHEMNNTPPSAASRCSSRLEWNEEDTSLGLAGPRGKQKELDQIDLEWVEGMKEKVMLASAEKEKEKRKGGHRQSLGELDKAGATKRMFRKTSRLEL
ncbi:hypothetical protein SBOR_8689 [Sclerotinia borealis F-4128]|uniref:GAR domain-containing protein n=1 Tax=Sclerotinia borealis (strain F-4128) TaxID=1432307 RepID=W9C2A7_SCLBF|nr:hypothetical protein SBOR_8689 [Sclerotinia borealis F-4128]